MAEVAGAAQSWTLNNLGFDGNVEEGSSLELRFKVLHSGTQPDMLDIRLYGESLCSTGVDDCVPPRPPTRPPTSPPTSPPTRPPSPMNSPTTSQQPTGACACDNHTIK